MHFCAIKKIIALLLSMLLTFSSAAMLFSCSRDVGNDDGASVGDGENTGGDESTNGDGNGDNGNDDANPR